MSAREWQLDNKWLRAKQLAAIWQCHVATARVRADKVLPFRRVYAKGFV